MDGTGELFSPFVAALPKSFETVIVRYPTDQCLSYQELEGLVRAACPTSEPYILLAESFSTPLAMRFAATHPENLAGIVLCAGFASSPATGLRRLLGRLLAPILFHLPLPSFAMKFWLVGPDASSSLVKTVKSAVSTVRPRVLATRMSAVLKCEARADLTRIEVPILYLQATGDRLVSSSCVEEIRQIRPQVKIEAIEAPHLILQRQPHRAAEVVAEFARSCFAAPTT
jgi:pimeloyl-[acyl-carrier protein] methyl ester esterase